jgi:hypothetical protein
MWKILIPLAVLAAVVLIQIFYSTKTVENFYGCPSPNVPAGTAVVSGTYTLSCSTGAISDPNGCPVNSGVGYTFTRGNIYGPANQVVSDSSRTLCAGCGFTDNGVWTCNVSTGTGTSTGTSVCTGTTTGTATGTGTASGSGISTGTQICVTTGTGTTSFFSTGTGTSTGTGIGTGTGTGTRRRNWRYAEDDDTAADDWRLSFDLDIGKDDEEYDPSCSSANDFYRKMRPKMLTDIVQAVMSQMPNLGYPSNMADGCSSTPSLSQGNEYIKQNAIPCFGCTLPQ